MKASDIPDMAIYERIVAKARLPEYAHSFPGLMIWDFENGAFGVTDKVLWAKMRQMIAKGRLRGCPCGCRGDWRLPWQEFGDRPDIEHWQDRIADYLSRGPRTYGY